MKNSEVLALAAGIQVLLRKEIKGGIAFNYAISRNKALFFPEADSITEASNSGLKHFQEEREELVAKYQGRPLNEKAVKDAFEDLNKRYEKELKESEDFLKAENSVKPYRIKLSTFPKELEANLFDVFFPIIDDDLDVEEKKSKGEEGVKP